MAVPASPKLYHICHVDKLAPIIGSGGLLSDAAVTEAAAPGTVIGMGHIKRRRLTELQLASHPGLFVGQCVPFYFCPRSVMLYLIHRRSSDLSYQGGQAPIVHLEADLHATIDWAHQNKLRWAFTLTNAGSRFFEDRSCVTRLKEINWDAVAATQWSACKDEKQAEFLVEKRFPWSLVERIGVANRATATEVAHALPINGHRPQVRLMPDWYY